MTLPWLDKLTEENIVATALFVDGAAACLLRSGESGLARVEMSGQHTWLGTLDIMGWCVDDTGLGVIFDRAIPPFAEANIAPAVAGILARGGLVPGDVDRFACLPGGAKVITALERALSLGQGALDHERTVLADCGNMSAPDCAFRSGKADRGRSAAAHPSDGHGAGVYRKLRFPAGHRVTVAFALPALVIPFPLDQFGLTRFGRQWKPVCPLLRSRLAVWATHCLATAASRSARVLKCLLTMGWSRWVQSVSAGWSSRVQGFEGSENRPVDGFPQER